MIILSIPLLTLGLLYVNRAVSEPVMTRIETEIEAGGFKVGHIYEKPADRPFTFSGFFTNKVAGLSIEIHAGECDSAEVRHQVLSGWSHSAEANPLPERSLSGMPVGEHCYAVGSDLTEIEQGHFVLDREYAVCDRFRVEVEVQGHPQGTPAEILATQNLVAQWCERLTREILANAVALDLNDDGMAKAPAAVTGLETNKEGYVPLTKWAHDHGITVTYDEAAASASFVFRRKPVELILASDRAVVGGRLVNLEGKFVLARGSRWLVPDLELTRAVAG
ncbi:MAG TPA: hypothetical protein VMI31_06265 [Fimbriimonadaceae bacterium]|nr:hypothetical protein [Fimbriimonadaceae bacterium]